MIAVLTGDIVNSTKMSEAEYAGTVEELRHQIALAFEKYHAIGEIYRGDGFQFQYPEPQNAITSTILLKLGLYLTQKVTSPIHCTLSLAFGEHQYYAEKPNTSSGPVFVTSGRGLENSLKGDFNLTLPNSDEDFEIRLLTRYLNHQLSRLTKKQAELLYQYIDTNFAKHKKLATLTNTSRQNISNRLNNIGAYLIRDYITIINDRIARLKDRNNGTIDMATGSTLSR